MKLFLRLTAEVNDYCDRSFAIEVICPGSSKKL